MEVDPKFDLVVNGKRFESLEDDEVTRGPIFYSIDYAQLNTKV